MIVWTKLLIDFFAAGLGSIGFGAMFKAQNRSLLPGGIIGGLGYVLYDLCGMFSLNPVFAAFLAALFVGVLGEILARALKTPALVFHTIGVIALVPGYGIYATMLSFVEGNNELALTKGVETLLVAAAIAVALGIASSLTRNAIRRFRKKQA